jgi:hypothetical protein
MDNKLLILTSIVLVVIIGLIIFQILKYLKGNLKLNLLTTILSSNEKLAGSVSLKLKKSVSSNALIVTLICYKEMITHSNGKASKSYKKYWWNEVQLDGVKTYGENFSNIYNFEMVVPSMSILGSVTNKASESLSDGQKEVFDKAKGLLNNYNNFTGNNRFKWKVEARLDCDGVDLTSTKKIIMDTF